MTKKQVTPLLSIDLRGTGSNNPQPQPWGDGTTYSNKYIAIVDHDGNIARFDYWGSVHDMQKNITPDSLDALDCILGDAICILNAPDIDSFSSELGYDKVSEAIKAFNGCREGLAKLGKIGISDDEIFSLSDIVRELQEA